MDNGRVQMKITLIKNEDSMQFGIRIQVKISGSISESSFVIYHFCTCTYRDSISVHIIMISMLFKVQELHFAETFPIEFQNVPMKENCVKFRWEQRINHYYWEVKEARCSRLPSTVIVSVDSLEIFQYFTLSVHPHSYNVQFLH